MGSSFNSQILVDKLAKLNVTQASIETLSHWCIFHMNKAHQVVETWGRQFHCSPREQRLAFLYLANDILQNSRRKGSEFVGEFWKVLPDALRDVIENGDESGKKAARRMINIWEERKVFGSRGHILKEELLGKQHDNGNRNPTVTVTQLKHPAGNLLDKIVSDYQVLYGGHIDEDAILSKCGNAHMYLEKVERESGSNVNSEFRKPATAEEVQEQHAILKDCIGQLTAVESSRKSLVSRLKEALHEEESKLEEVRNQIQAAESHADRASNLCRQLLNYGKAQLVAEQSSKEVHSSVAPEILITRNQEHSAPAMYDEISRKSAAAAVAAKLTASTSSAEMLSYVLSSLVSEAANGNPINEISGDQYLPEKRLKLDNNDNQSYIPPQQTMHQNVTSTSQMILNEMPTGSSSSPLLPLLPPMPPYQALHYMQTPVPSSTLPFSYNACPQQQSPMHTYATGSAPANSAALFTMPSSQNSYQSFQSSDGFYNQPTAPISRQ